ncbi:MAG: acyl-CoA thioester hydrolase/BAAT C-terminal domain-containing protein [Actinomycetes bacterium]
MRTDQRILEIRAGRRWPLVDEPVGLVVAGARPGSEVAVRATVEVAGAVHQARATFDADQAGVVDTARQASRAGSYTGVDPFGLWWSGQPVGPSRRPPSAPLTARVQAATAGRMAEAVLERHWLTLEAAATPVREPGVWGLFARPAGDGPFPGVVCFGGSSGGLAAAAAWAPVLASHGFATLAIAYFGVPGLPGALVGIEVEVVERAAAWLLGRPDVRGGRVAVVGMSRGSELALLAGTLLDRVGAVVGFAPSGVSWSGYGPGGPVDAPAWSFRGAPIPYLGGDATPPPGFRTAGPITLRPLFERTLQDADAVRAAEIPVERAAGPILLVSGKADAMWPATRLGELVERRAAAARSTHPVAHLRYPGAGHAGVGVPGTTAPTEVRHPVDGASYALGGMPAANAAARADSWPRVLAFLAAAGS